MAEIKESLELQKKPQTNKEKEPHWANIVAQTRVWHMLVVQATQQRAEHLNSTYRSTIDALITTLFKEERDVIVAYRNQLFASKNRKELTDLKQYDALLERIVDLLHERKYLLALHTPDDAENETYVPGHQGVTK
jgi:hypothetical protein